MKSQSDQWLDRIETNLGILLGLMLLAAFWCFLGAAIYVLLHYAVTHTDWAPIGAAVRQAIEEAFP